MKRIGSWLFALIIILAMVLSACGSEALPETINATAAQDPGSSAVQDPGSPNLSYAVAEDINAAFNSFLDNIVGYNTSVSMGWRSCSRKSRRRFCSTSAL
ncbi:MAG: hypothetical protein E3J69_04065 [Anaerolineales bacterium]|nr:MAG: hypothetical protein E3J69_04065 [Anaerolineales bacterium]